MPNPNLLKELLNIYNLLSEGKDKKDLEYILNLIKISITTNKVSLKFILLYLKNKLKSVSVASNVDGKSLILWRKILNIFQENVKSENN